MRKRIFTWLCVLLLITALLPCAYAAEGNLGTATVSEYYSSMVYASAPDAAFMVSEGSLPPGLDLDGAMLSGTPTEAGVYDFTVSDGVESIHCSLTVLSAAPVSPDPAVIESITLNSAPAKLNYLLGDSLDTTGLLVDVHYAGLDSVTVDSGFTCSPVSFDSVGQIPVTVSYQGFRCSFEVMVEHSQNDIGGIGLVALPSKTEYKLGESLVQDGIIVRVYYEDKTHFDIEGGFSCYPELLDKAGEQTITLTYLDKACYFTVNVVKEETPVALNVTKMPDKVNYVVGEALDTTGLTLLLTMDSGTTEKLRSGFVCYPVVMSTAGVQTITVSYDKFTCYFNVTVSETAASPSPSSSPSPSAAPSPSPTAAVSPSPSVSPTIPDTVVTPHAGEHKAHEGGVSAGVMTFIVIAALLLLAGLGGFVFVSRRGGIENVKEDIRRLLARFKK